MTKPQPVGRPRSDFAKRYAIRTSDLALSRWALAAATCGMTIQDWIRATLDGEAGKAHHVPEVKRRPAR